MGVRLYVAGSVVDGQEIAVQDGQPVRAACTLLLVCTTLAMFRYKSEPADGVDVVGDDFGERFGGQVL